MLDRVTLSMRKVLSTKDSTMSGEEVSQEKKQNQTDVRLLRAWYRAVGLSEDEIAQLIHEPAIDERTALNQGKPIRPR